MASIDCILYAAIDVAMVLLKFKDVLHCKLNSVHTYRGRSTVLYSIKFNSLVTKCDYHRKTITQSKIRVQGD